MKILVYGNLIESLFSVDRWLNYERQITQKLIKLFKVVYNAQVIKHTAQVTRELVMISLAFVFNRNSSRKNGKKEKQQISRIFLTTNPYVLKFYTATVLVK